VKWLIEAIMEQLKCSEASAYAVWDEMDRHYDGRFSELTSRQVKSLIRDYAYAVAA
jgi:hypothetical protein